MEWPEHYVGRLLDVEAFALKICWKRTGRQSEIKEDKTGASEGKRKRKVRWDTERFMRKEGVRTG